MDWTGKCIQCAFMSDFQFDCCEAHVVVFYHPDLNSPKETQRVTMSSDFSDNSGRAGSWKRTRLLGGGGGCGGGGEGTAHLSLGKNTLRLAFPPGFRGPKRQRRSAAATHTARRLVGRHSCSPRPELPSLSHPPALSWQTYVTSRSQCLSSIFPPLSLSPSFLQRFSAFLLRLNPCAVHSSHQPPRA